MAFTRAHIDQGLALSQACGWPHRREDWEMLVPLSQGVAAVSEGRVVGTALRADCGAHLSTVNMIIVDAALRGRGLGRALMAGAMGEDPRTYRLVATDVGRPLYEKLGFGEAAWVEQWQGTVGAAPPQAHAQRARPEDLAEVAQLESRSYGGDRAAVVQWLWDNADIAVIRFGGAVTGYAAFRRFGHGNLIGPVVAANEADARALVLHFAQGLEGAFLRLDVTETSGLGPFLGELGLAPVARAPVMERGGISARAERMALFSQALV